eukprot:140409-Chlamydomonas_euryale.AAC.1
MAHVHAEVAWRMCTPLRLHGACANPKVAWRMCKPPEVPWRMRIPPPVASCMCNLGDHHMCNLVERQRRPAAIPDLCVRCKSRHVRNGGWEGGDEPEEQGQAPGRRLQ